MGCNVGIGLLRDSTAVRWNAFLYLGGSTPSLPPRVSTGARGRCSRGGEGADFRPNWTNSDRTGQNDGRISRAEMPYY
jgi:hypothetical protein